MITINKFVVVLFVFFLVSSGMFIIFTNIGLVNNNLSSKSQQDLSNLNIYNQTTSNPFGKPTNLNYSLTAYSNTNPYTQSNIETKGGLNSILNIFGSNQLTAFQAPFVFMEDLMPIPISSISWTFTMILTLIGILIFIGFFAAWKGGFFGK